MQVHRFYEGDRQSGPFRRIFYFAKGRTGFVGEIVSLGGAGRGNATCWYDEGLPTSWIRRLCSGRGITMSQTPEGFTQGHDDQK